MPFKFQTQFCHRGDAQTRQSVRLNLGVYDNLNSIPIESTPFDFFYTLSKVYF